MSTPRTTSISRRAAVVGLVAAGLSVRHGASAGAFSPGTPSSDTGLTDRVLVDVTVPADAFVNPIPGGDRLSLFFTHSIIPPNTTSTWETTLRAEHPGPEIEYILEGSVSLTSEGSAQITRAEGDGTSEEAPAGTPIELGSGDVVIHRVEHQSTWVSGDAPVGVLAGFAVATSVAGEYNPDEWEDTTHTYKDNAGPVPTGPSRLRIRRVEMEPDAAVAFAAGTLKVFLIHGGGSGNLGEGSDGSVSLIGATEPAIVYFFSIEPAPDSATPAA
jgi:hypothetical protein